MNLGTAIQYITNITIFHNYSFTTTFPLRMDQSLWPCHLSLSYATLRSLALSLLANLKDALRLCGIFPTLVSKVGSSPSLLWDIVRKPSLNGGDII